MNNNDNKKPANLWVRRLFKQSGISKTVPQNKSYFAHRYHAGHSAPGTIPFRALFADEGENQFNLAANKADFQQVFEHELTLSADKQQLADSTLIYGSNCLDATQDSLCHNNLPLCAQFTVLNCFDETLDTKTFRLGGLDSQHFDYLPGQYITISVEIKGQEHKRSYSLASTPTRPGNLEITVKRDPKGGVVSNWLNDNLKVGDTLDIKVSFGKFTCAKDTPKKILFIAAGSGIVPIMSMLRWLTDTHACTDVVLLLSFRTEYDIIFGDELNLVASRHKNINLFITLTKEPLFFSKWSGLIGRINEKMIAERVPDVAGRVVYLCGPDAFMKENKTYLLNLDVPVRQVFCESFTVNGTTAAAPDSTIDQSGFVQSASAMSTRTKVGNFEVNFSKSGKTIAADGAINLLDLAEKSGIAIRHECRAGNCGECMVKCLKGNIEMAEQAEIDDLDRKKGWVYACCAYPASNVVLDV